MLVTGGTDGLGAALADRLVEEGARVAVCGRDPDRLAAAEQRLRDAGGDALVVQSDVTSLADLERFVDAAIARWGRLDGLVNNAGKSAAGRRHERDESRLVDVADLDEAEGMQNAAFQCQVLLGCALGSSEGRCMARGCWITA